MKRLGVSIAILGIGCLPLSAEPREDRVADLRGGLDYRQNVPEPKPDPFADLEMPAPERFEAAPPKPGWSELKPSRVTSSVEGSIQNFSDGKVVTPQERRAMARKNPPRVVSF